MVLPKLRKTASLLGALKRYVVPRGDAKVRLRIGAAFTCLVAAKGSNMVTPLLHGAAVDLVNGGSSFAMSALLFLVGGYALAHRLSTIVHADEIIVLCGGEIVERGTHRKLLRKSGLYAQMWERQSSGFSGEDDDTLIDNRVERVN